MKKRIILIMGGFLLCAIIIVFMVLSINSINMRDLPGEIVISNYDLSNSKESGILIYKPSTGEKKVIANKERFPYINYDSTGERLIAVKDIGDIFKSIRNYSLHEYSFKENKFNPIAKTNPLDKDSFIDYENIKYVPYSNKISYVWDNKLYIYDINTETEKELLDNIEDEYTWSKDASYFMYNNYDESMIYKYIIKDEKSVPVFKGESPVLSPGNKYLAYKEGYDNLSVIDLQKGTKWRYNGFGITHYVFSPDERYIAIIDGKRHTLFSIEHKIIVWDFEKDRVQDLFGGDTYWGMGLGWR